MTVKEYIDRIESYPEQIQNELLAAPIWNDTSCLGYCAIALENLGATEDQILKVIRELHDTMDTIEPEEAGMRLRELF